MVKYTIVNLTMTTMSASPTHSNFPKFRRDEVTAILGREILAQTQGRFSRQIQDVSVDFLKGVYDGLVTDVNLYRI